MTKPHESRDLPDLGSNHPRPPELPADLPAELLDASEADAALSPGSGCQGGAHASDEGHVPLAAGDQVINHPEVCGLLVDDCVFFFPTWDLMG